MFSGVEPISAARVLISLVELHCKNEKCVRTCSYPPAKYQRMDHPDLGAGPARSEAAEKVKYKTLILASNFFCHSSTIPPIAISTFVDLCHSQPSSCAHQLFSRHLLPLAPELLLDTPKSSTSAASTSSFGRSYPRLLAQNKLLCLQKALTGRPTRRFQLAALASNSRFTIPAPPCIMEAP